MIELLKAIEMTFDNQLIVLLMGDFLIMAIFPFIIYKSIQTISFKKFALLVSEVVTCKRNFNIQKANAYLAFMMVSMGYSMGALYVSEYGYVADHNVETYKNLYLATHSIHSLFVQLWTIILGVLIGLLMQTEVIKGNNST